MEATKSNHTFIYLKTTDITFFFKPMSMISKAIRIQIFTSVTYWNQL